MLIERFPTFHDEQNNYLYTYNNPSNFIFQLNETMKSLNQPETNSRYIILTTRNILNTFELTIWHWRCPGEGQQAQAKQDQHPVVCCWRRGTISTVDLRIVHLGIYRCYILWTSSFMSEYVFLNTYTIHCF